MKITFMTEDGVVGFVAEGSPDELSAFMSEWLAKEETSDGRAYVGQRIPKGTPLKDYPKGVKWGEDSGETEYTWMFVQEDGLGYTWEHQRIDNPRAFRFAGPDETPYITGDYLTVTEVW